MALLLFIFVAIFFLCLKTDEWKPLMYAGGILLFIAFIGLIVGS